MVIQRDFIEIMANKAKVEVYIEVLRDVFQNFEWAEYFIEQQVEEICEWRKISVVEVFYFYVYFVL